MLLSPTSSTQFDIVTTRLADLLLSKDPVVAEEAVYSSTPSNGYETEFRSCDRPPPGLNSLWKLSPHFSGFLQKLSLKAFPPGLGG
jgi:hypothetical protein